MAVNFQNFFWNQKFDMNFKCDVFIEVIIKPLGSEKHDFSSWLQKKTRKPFFIIYWLYRETLIMVKLKKNCFSPIIELQINFLGKTIRVVMRE